MGRGVRGKGQEFLALFSPFLLRKVARGKQKVDIWFTYFVRISPG